MRPGNEDTTPGALQPQTRPLPFLVGWSKRMSKSSAEQSECTASASSSYEHTCRNKEVRDNRALRIG